MSFQKKLLSWFDKNKRALPWREHYRPYEVWISEIMLQQTQMDTALPYFSRWLKSFPDLASLAAAEEKTVLKHWEGLGYYSRARNLHFTAKQIVEKHEGQFPSDYDTILSLKGVGRYTAGAIASIAFNQDRPIVDGNVLRVLSRVYTLSNPIDLDKTIFWELQEKLIPKGQARHFNQGLMELGALVCLSRSPRCGECPVKSHCKAYASGTQENYPVKSKKKLAVKVEAAAVVVEAGEKFLIQRRPEGKIMGGLWEFPEWKLAKDKPLSKQAVKTKALENFTRDMGKTATNLKNLGLVKRNYTHHNESLHVFKASQPKTFKPRHDWEYAWASKQDFKKYPFSSAHAKIADWL